MMTDDTDNLRLLALAATSRPMVAPTRAVDESKRRPVPSKWPRTWMQV